MIHRYAAVFIVISNIRKGDGRGHEGEKHKGIYKDEFLEIPD